MDEVTSPQPAPRRLIAPARIRELILHDHPDYGKGLTDTDWDRIAGRVEDLARLIWDFSCRRSGVAGQPKEDGQ